MNQSINIKEKLLKIIEEDMPKKLTSEQRKKIDDIKKELLKDESKSRIC